MKYPLSRMRTLRPIRLRVLDSAGNRTLQSYSLQNNLPFSFNHLRARRFSSHLKGLQRKNVFLYNKNKNMNWPSVAAAKLSQYLSKTADNKNILIEKSVL